MLKKNRILGLDLGSRELGYAVLDGHDLVSYGVKSLKKFRPQKLLKESVKEILIRLVIEYGIKALVVESSWFNQITSPLFQAVFDTVREVAGKKKLKMVTYTPNTVRKIICGQGKANKKQMARLLVERYPELKIYIEPNRRWKEKYWLNAFDALGVGLTYILQKEEDNLK